MEVDYFVVLTEANFVYLNFNKPGQQEIKKATVSEMKTYLEEGNFLEGSMKPKVEPLLISYKKEGRNPSSPVSIICFPLLKARQELISCQADHQLLSSTVSFPSSL